VPCTRTSPRFAGDASEVFEIGSGDRRPRYARTQVEPNQLMKANAIPPGFDRLLDYLRDTRGLDLGGYKTTTLSRRIEKRMGMVGVPTYPAYIDYLEVHPDEFAQLFNIILINVTAFFRDPPTFELLRTSVLPGIIGARDPDDPIRVWSAGCASGEEPYSVAILLAELLGPQQFRDRVKIYATDVDEEALTAARQAAYTGKQMEAVPPDLRPKYFDQNGSHSVVKKEFRRSVIFGRHELLQDAPISRVDLLMCRNTLMYFNQEAQERITARFRFALRDGGYLVLGKAETLLKFAGIFDPVDLKHRVFRKRTNGAANDRVQGTAAAREDRTEAGGLSERLRDIAFDHDPNAQIVLDGRGIVLVANRRARDLFGLQTGDIGRPMQDLEVSYRPVELRSCIEDAHARRQAVHVRDVAWPTPGGERRYFNVYVTPIFDTDGALGTKILFVNVTRQHDLQDELQRSRQELETAYEELQSTNEELETTNEELQSTVEELETTNEELQSTNEELGTINERLHTANEELGEVNQELRKRGIDLTRSKIFLTGILRSVPLGVVVMDESLHVELWNDVAADMWGVRQDDVKGKHFLGLEIGLPVHQLRQPLLSLRHAPDAVSETTIQATNRHGRPVKVRVLCSSVGGAAADAHGAILLMQETGESVH
jgi:two-component system CheB/CheR fusion protein